MSTKKCFWAIPLLFSLLSFNSCSPKIVNKEYYTFVTPELREKYLGKSKEYIIRSYPYNITEIKRLDSDYEILIFRRYVNYLVGERYSKFFMKNGVCYDIETNEYTIKSKEVRVSYLNWLLGNY